MSQPIPVANKDMAQASPLMAQLRQRLLSAGLLDSTLTIHDWLLFLADIRPELSLKVRKQRRIQLFVQIAPFVVSVLLVCAFIYLSRFEEGLASFVIIIIMLGTVFWLEDALRPWRLSNIGVAESILKMLQEEVGAKTLVRFQLNICFKKVPTRFDRKNSNVKAALREPFMSFDTRLCDKSKLHFDVSCVTLKKKSRSGREKWKGYALLRARLKMPKTDKLQPSFRRSPASLASIKRKQGDRYDVISVCKKHPTTVEAYGYAKFALDPIQYLSVLTSITETRNLG